MKIKKVVHCERLKFFYEGKENCKQFQADQADKAILDTHVQTDTQIKDAVVPPLATERVDTNTLTQPPHAETLIITTAAPLADKAASLAMKFTTRPLTTKIKKTKIR